MKKRKVNIIAVSFAVLILLVVALLLRNSLRRSSHIVLPERTEPVPTDSGSQSSGAGALEVVEVTPDTVQAVIATLTRPENYCRSITVDRYWTGGSGETTAFVTVDGSWTRTDATLASGQIRHAVTNGETTYIWYGDSKSYYTGAAGEITADDEQAIPTYENILQLSTKAISVADYRQLSEVNCIYVETKPDADGDLIRYWVGVNTGLLVAAERVESGTIIYRMTALALSDSTPTTADFTLPDGTVLQKITS